MGLGVFGVEFDRPAVAGFGRGFVAGGGVREAQVVLVFGVVGVEVHGFAVAIGRLVDAVELEVGAAE